MNNKLSRKATIALPLAATLVAFVAVTTGLQSAAASQSNPTEQKLQALENAQQALTERMQSGDLNGVPINMVYVDPKTSRLVIGIDANVSSAPSVFADKVKALTGGVPTKLSSVSIEPTDCATRTSNCDPLYGSIQVAYGTKGSSLGFVDTNTAGKKGFIITGHSTGWGKTGSAYDIGQATSSREVGHIITNPGSATSTRTSDTAFVELRKDANGNYLYAGAEERVWISSSTSYKIVGKKTNAQINFDDPVNMRGAASGLKNGFVNGKNLTFDHPTQGILTGQFLATYVPQEGDSGAPVTSGVTNVQLYGINWAKVTIDGFNYGSFSTWDGIKGELSLP